MKYRTIPGTDLEVSVICFGTMRLKGNPEAGEKAMLEALESGINFIHSSYQYKTRWLLDKVLKDYPGKHKLHHAIKVPVPEKGDNGQFSAAKFRMRVEEALRELHTERIDIVQWLFLDTDAKPDEEKFLLGLPQMVDEMMEVFEKIRDEGKAGHIVCQARTPLLRDGLVETGKFAGVVERYSLMEMLMAARFDLLKSRDMFLLPLQPLYMGLLTDRRLNRSALPEDDRFSSSDYDQDYVRLQEISEAFRDEISDSMTSFALRFALAPPVIPSILTGLNNVQQVHEALAASEGPFPSKQIMERALQIWNSQTG